MQETTPQAIIADFVSGSMDVASFVACMYEREDICDYLQKIVDHFVINNEHPKRKTIVMKGVAQNKPFQPRSYVEDFIPELRKKNPLIFDLPGQQIPTVKEQLVRCKYRTAYGACLLHNIVSDIYYQVDSELEQTKCYSEAYELSLDVLPRYIAGGEAEGYISEYIIPKYPKDMKKTERKKLIKEEIRNTFKRDCKGFPHWIQDPEWPLGQDGKPMVYMGQKKYESYTEYFFRGDSRDEKKTVRQLW